MIGFLDEDGLRVFNETLKEKIKDEIQNRDVSVLDDSLVSLEKTWSSSKISDVLDLKLRWGVNQPPAKKSFVKWKVK